MMTLRPTTLRFLLASLAPLLLGACDLGQKSIGDELGDAGDGDGDGDSGDGDGDGDSGDGDSGDGDPGDGDGDDQPEGACGEETVTMVDDPLAALPGFDGVVADYLAMVEGSFAGEFTWSGNDGPVTLAHAGTQSELTVTVSYDGGEVRLTEVELLGQFPDDGVFECTNTVEIDVSLGFATADGLFAETFEIPVTVSSATSDGDGELPSFYFSLDMDALAGELALADITVDDGDIQDLILHGSFDGETVNGGLGLEFGLLGGVAFGNIAQFSAARVP